MISFEDMPEITKGLAKVNEHIERLCQSNNASMQKVIDWVLAARGKQIRPILTLLCSKLKEKKKDASEMAAVVEIAHTASLIHDDVIDNADERRGQMTVHNKFGREMAVYAGDFMIFVTLGRTNLRSKPWYKDMFQNLEVMCDGELAQFDNQYNVDISEEQYVSNIIGKTSSMFRIACVSGAHVGGCDETERYAVGEYATYFGLLFQMRDDLMDFVSTNKVSLKTVHNDFKFGYYTLPAIYTFANAEYGDELREYARLAKEGRFDEVDDDKISEIIAAAGGFTYAYGKIRKYAASAIDSLACMPDTKYRRKLEELIQYLVETTPQGL
ncbi:MAG: polyprenyl synthetase family protein [Lachnospiraceae bacterium]|nr:polyprenyl synthetase family protein [Lachnospiraceae bacterium]